MAGSNGVPDILQRNSRGLEAMLQVFEQILTLVNATDRIVVEPAKQYDGLLI